MHMVLTDLNRYVERVNSELPDSDRVKAQLIDDNWSENSDGGYSAIEWSIDAGYVALEYSPQSNTIILHDNLVEGSYPSGNTREMINNLQRRLDKIQIQSE